MNGLLSSATASMQGTLHGQDRSFNGVSTDTRTLQSGELFFALSGPNFDGGEFVAQATAKGAAGAVVAAATDVDIAQITVDDTRLALGRLGSAWRTEQPVTVIGVTGSNGKTTLRELIAACLSQLAPTLATQGNLNNDIGMPLMLLCIEPSHRYAVLEMGANHAGEIAYLTSLAKPDVVVITNAAAAHLEGFGSVEGVAHAKGEILQGSSRPAAAILNADDDYYDYWSTLAADIDTISFGLGNDADVHADEITVASGRTSFDLHLSGVTYPVSLALSGTHNVRNACAAAAVASVHGVAPEDIVAALASVAPVDGRLQPVPGLGGATLFDDSYNANPRSVIAAAEFLASLPGENWFVLGDMYELGAGEQYMHRDTGAAIRDAGVDRLFTVGELCQHAAEGFGDRGTWFTSIEALTTEVAAELTDNVNVLIKGSRGMRMERVVDALRAADAVRREA